MPEKSVAPHKPNITYFRPEQLIFHVNENLRDAPEKIRDLINWANELAESKGIQIKISFPKPEDVLDFKPTPNPDLAVITPLKDLQNYPELSYESPSANLPDPFSLVVADAKSNKWSEVLSNQVGEEETEEIRKLQAEAMNDLLDLVILLDETYENRPLNLTTVSPNWLMNGSASSPGSTGGPGGRPTPYDGPVNTKQYMFSFDLPENRGESVVVAILDTAPKLRDETEDSQRVLTRIYDEWVPHNASGEEHLLLKTLLGENGRLKKVYFDNEVDKPIPGVVPNGYLQAEDHDYEMSDHGMFVAGVIHSIAPQAELHLFQVLNRYGVGDIASIARALRQIHDDNQNFPKDRLLVNLSLTIDIPLAQAHGRNDEMLRKIRSYIRKHRKWPESQSQTISSICESLYAQGSKVIAAAGNNRRKGRSRPRACYPAAFPSVLGVAALPISEITSDKKFKTASYSNRSDRPARTGIATLGGEEGEKLGVLGIYLEEFPESKTHPTPTKSSNGWGWWAGTSFATPIITGMTAAMRSFTPGVSSMEAAVREVFGVQRDYETRDLNEDVLYVKQGP